jgi:hypothetical protein
MAGPLASVIALFAAIRAACISRLSIVSSVYKRLQFACLQLPTPFDFAPAGPEIPLSSQGDTAVMAVFLLPGVPIEARAQDTFDPPRFAIQVHQ